jgi:hypothetical protein
MIGDSDKPVRLVSFEDDQPTEVRGSLIPQPRRQTAPASFTPRSAHTKTSHRGTTRSAVAVFAMVGLAVLGTSGYGYMSDNSQSAAPVLSVVDEATNSVVAIDYGQMPGLSQVALFTETRDAFIDEGLTFIEIDEVAEQVRFFDEGVLLISEEILSIGEPGSVHDLNSGLFQVDGMLEEQFSTLGQVYLPWLIKFQGNYIIHGQPTLPCG